MVLSLALRWLAMPIPFEAVLPMAVVTVFFGVTGTGFSLVSRLTNDGKVCGGYCPGRAPC